VVLIDTFYASSKTCSGRGAANAALKSKGIGGAARAQRSTSAM
jgi:transposase